MSSLYDLMDFASTIVTSNAVTATGDKFTWSPPIAVAVPRWGVFGNTLLDVGAGMTIAFDVIPDTGGTRVEGAVTTGFDVGGGVMTRTSDVALGTGIYHEIKFDPSGTVSPGAGVNKLGNMLLLLPGDTAVIEVTDAADTAGASATFWIQYYPMSFQAARDTTYTKVNS